jgi:deoxyribose-phosphate aldolase
MEVNLETSITYFAKGMERVQQAEIASIIDHTLLKPNATAEQIDVLCEEAKRYGFASVCVNPYWIEKAVAQLVGTQVNVCIVVGFPLGANTQEVKVFETQNAVDNGATEIDMVINLGAFKSGDFEIVKAEIGAVVQAAQGRLVKVILETGLLLEEEVIRAAQLAKEAGAHFVKTSTGFGQGGATVAAVQWMRKTVGSKMGVKASGGVSNFQIAQQMIAAGANRIGTSAGVAIVTGG